MDHHASGRFANIPVINVSALAGNDEAGLQLVAQQMRKAAIEVGFFYVDGHNIGRDLIRAVLMASKYFFSLPEETKQSITVNQAHRGYIGFSQTTQPGRKIADLKESFNFAFPFAPDSPEVLAQRPLTGLNQWPAGETAWRALIEDYYREVFALGQQILKALAVSLGLERNFFQSLYKEPLVRARLLHYPPVAGSATDGESNGEQYGAAEHTDYGTITLLWQDDVGGLQVKNRQGDWIAAPYIDNTFVVNIGDMLARWTNDLFVSTPHRVINASGRERYSIPVFYDPDFDVRVECLPHCSSSDNPPKYAPVTVGEYITARYDGSYAYRQPPAK